MPADTLKIFFPAITPRLEYVAEVIFKTILGISYEIVSDLNDTAKKPHVTYSDEDISDSIRIIPDGLMTSAGIRSFEPDVKWLGGIPVLFPSVENGSFPFDIFSASFYMLSRYEEHLHFKPDVHGRFQGAGSLAYRKGFLKLPVVDLWASLLLREIKKKFPEIQSHDSEYSALLTIDVDQAYAYKGRGLLNNIGGLVKDIYGSGRTPGLRLKTVTGIENDPYDMFAYIREKTEESDTKTIFFFPVGDRSDHDHNSSYKDDGYKSLIKSIDHLNGSGLHSSYLSSGRLNVLCKEARRYKNITGHEPARCRQHWLLLQMPDTYRSFINVGIREDYTMGFADEPGFRAGIARPFRFYDLGKEMMTELTLVPFQFMDGTLRQYKNMSTEKAIEEISNLIEVTKQSHGLFVSVWHNTSVTEENGWEGWRRVFEETIRMQKQ